jgi:hypothetical protein
LDFWHGAVARADADAEKPTAGGGEAPVLMLALCSSGAATITADAAGASRRALIMSTLAPVSAAVK